MTGVRDTTTHSNYEDVSTNHVSDDPVLKGIEESDSFPGAFQLDD